MKKKIQKPFNVEEAKNGARVERRDGKPVRIICYDRVDTAYPIIALIKSYNGENCFFYDINGKLAHHEYNNEDLVIIEEVECPKFNVGDWVFMNTHGSQPWLVIKVTPNYYEIKDSSGYITAKSHHTIDSLFHPWTLKDAKPGNILASTDGCCPFIFKGFYYDGAPTAYCGIDTTDSIYISDEDLPWTRNIVRPATYEERQLLFNKLEAEGYKWNAESLTLTKIQKKWRYEEVEDAEINGYYINSDSHIVKHSGYNADINHNLFATEKQAKSALAMARISQIMANDKRFGGIVTDEEWGNNVPCYYVILKVRNILVITTSYRYEYLGFHTMEQANLFLEENEDLVKDYYMLD